MSTSLSNTIGIECNGANRVSSFHQDACRIVSGYVNLSVEKNYNGTVFKEEGVKLTNGSELKRHRTIN